MICKNCGKCVKYVSAHSWLQGMCPQCMESPIIREKERTTFDDFIFGRKINPVDIYWNLLTERQVSIDSQRL